MAAISEACSPRVLVYATSDVNPLLQDTIHLPDLATLLQPWQTNGVERVTVRTSAFETLTLAAFPLRIDSANALPQGNALEWEGNWLDQLSSEMSAHIDQWLKDTPIDSLDAPWYNTFLKSLIELRPLSTHQTFDHPTMCLLATSTKHPEPLNALSDLYAATSPSSFMADKPYVDPNVFRYYVVLHDVQNGNLIESQALLDQVRRAYGVHCALLPFNSYDPDAPPPLEGTKDTRPAAFDTLWKPFLHETVRDATVVSGMGEKDALALRIFLRDMVVMSLVPWMERNVQQWNESLAAARRGLTNRLFSAGRKYFGSASGRSTPTGQAPAYNTSKGYYSHQTQEAQTKRLADFAFMIRDYKLAASIYDLLRGDFQRDKAWRDFAQATRMFGLSQLMSSIIAPSQAKRPDVDSLLEQAYTTAVSLGGQLGITAQFDNLKATVLFYEAYKVIQETNAAPIALQRVAGQDEEVHAGLLLEQAAISNFKRRPTPSARKAAFYLYMASQRYEKTGQKALAHRCLTRAASIHARLPPVDADKPVELSGAPHTAWYLTQQTTLHSLGRHAYSLGHATEAMQHFFRFLEQSAEQPNQDSPVDDQDAWDDLVNAHEALTKSSKENEASNLAFKAKFFDPNGAKLIIAGVNDESKEYNWEWIEEELVMALKETVGAPSLVQAVHNQVGVAEKFHLQLQLKNKLNANFTLSNIRIEAHLFGGTKMSSNLLILEDHEAVHLGPTESASVCCLILPLLLAQDNYQIRLTMNSQIKATFRITGVSYLLNGILPCSESLVRKGNRLHLTKEHLVRPTYAQDTSLDVAVREPVPLLDTDLSNIPASLLQGESVFTSIRLTNTGSVPLASITIISDQPSILIPLEKRPDSGLYDSPHCTDTHHITIPSRFMQTESIRLSISPKDTTVELPILLHGNKTGLQELGLVFAYSASSEPNRFYTTRRTVSIKIEPSIQAQIRVSPSFEPDSSFVMGLEIANHHAKELFHVEGISVLAPLWHLAAAEAASSSDIEVAPQQSAQVLLKLERAAATKAELCQPGYTPAKLERLLAGGDDLKSPLPTDDDVFFSSSSHEVVDLRQNSLLVASLLALRSADVALALTAQFPSISSKLYPLIFRLFAPLSLDVVVFWSLPASGKRGHSLLTGLQVGPPTNTVHGVLSRAEGIAGGIYAESQRERHQLLSNIAKSEFGQSANPVVVLQKFESHVALEHPRRLKKIKCTFILQNLSPFFECQFALVLLRGNVDSVPWVKATTFKGVLKAGQVQDLTATMAFSHSGTYSAGSWQLQVATPTEHWVTEGSPDKLVYVNARTAEDINA